MMRLRGFEHVSGYETAGLPLPARSTPGSAGYDFVAAENICLPAGERALIPTGIKAYMLQDEYLGMHIRSSLAVKHGLQLVNAQGVIDSDYYNNPENEGHIRIALVNCGRQAVTIERGMRIAQGIFYKFLLADADQAAEKAGRSGGIGSTGQI